MDPFSTVVDLIFYGVCLYLGVVVFIVVVEIIMFCCFILFAKNVMVHTDIHDHKRLFKR